MSTRNALVSSVVVATMALALLGAALPALAGGPPSWYVAVNSGQFAPWGQEIVSSTIVAVDPDFAPDNQTFAPLAQTNSWTAITLYGGQMFGYISRITPPASIAGKIWSGPGETRPYYQTTFALYGNVWGTRELTVRNSTGFPVILNVPYANGTSNTYLFSSAESYTYELNAVPEPGSMVAMLSGLVGLAGFGLRRKK